MTSDSLGSMITRLQVCHVDAHEAAARSGHKIRLRKDGVEWESSTTSSWENSMTSSITLKFMSRQGDLPFTVFSLQDQPGRGVCACLY